MSRWFDGCRATLHGQWVQLAVRRFLLVTIDIKRPVLTKGHGTDRETDGRMAVSRNALYTFGGGT